MQDAYEATLDAWARVDCTLLQISLATGMNYSALRAILERGRINGDPRAITSAEHMRRMKQGQIRPCGPKGMTKAEWVGIKIGPRVCRTEYSITGLTLHENWITLSGGLLRQPGDVLETAAHTREMQAAAE